MSSVSAEKGTEGKVSREDFDQITKGIEKFESPDYELLSSIFIMSDASGEGFVNYKEFIAGIAGCLVSGSVTEKLQAAFELYNIDDDSPSITRSDLRKLLTSINNIASFFGDPVVTAENIDLIVIDSFKEIQNATAPIPYADCIVKITSHPCAEVFISGQGAARFGR